MISIQYDPNMAGEQHTHGAYNQRFTPWKFCPLMVFNSPLNPRLLSVLYCQGDGSLIYSKLHNLGIPFNRPVFVAHYTIGRSKLSGVCYDVFDPISRFYVRVYNHDELVCKRLKPNEVPNHLNFSTDDVDRAEMVVPDPFDVYAEA